MSTSFDNCESGHEPVAYNGYETACPVCAMEDIQQEKIDEITKERNELEDRVLELESEVDDLKEQLTQFKSIEDTILNAVKEKL